MQSDRMQALSKSLFGQIHRLALLIAIADSRTGQVNPTDLAVELGLAQSAFQKPLRDLVDAGIVRHETSARRNVYIRDDSNEIWPWVRQMKERLRAEEEREPSSIRQAG